MVENSGSSVPYKFIFEEQNLLDETKAILANIFRDYWASEYQRERILAKEKYDLQKLEEKKRPIFHHLSATNWKERTSRRRDPRLQKLVTQHVWIEKKKKLLGYKRYREEKEREKTENSPKIVWRTLAIREQQQRRKQSDQIVLVKIPRSIIVVERTVWNKKQKEKESIVGKR